MKLFCHRPTFTAAMQLVSGVVPTRTPKDILKNVKLVAEDGIVTLIATDQEIGIRYEVPGVEADTGGEILLPTNRIISILRELQDDGVTIEATSDKIRIAAGQSEFNLAAADPAEFPPVASFDGDQWYTVPGKSLKEMIRRTAFATDVESTRYALGGLLLEIDDVRITMAATDSRRLAVVESTITAHGGVQPPVSSPVVPTKAMTLVERTITDDEADVDISVRANEVLIRCGRATIYSRLVEGRFPRYADVIPKESKKQVELLTAPFHGAIRQAQIVTNEESRGVDFNFADGTLTLISKAAEIGESKVELPINFEGDEITITFDPRYVAEFLRVLDPEKPITLHLIDGENAAVFKTDDNYTYVIMPLSRDR
jgi:DNA polymerase-3 subunit beta